MKWMYLWRDASAVFFWKISCWYQLFWMAVEPHLRGGKEGRFHARNLTEDGTTELVLWSFKPGTYQTGSFAELTPTFQTWGTRSRKFRAPSSIPNDWDPPAPYRFYSGLCQPRGDWRGLIGFPTMARILIDTKERKSSDDFVSALGMTQQELWRFRKSSRDNRWLAIPSPSDPRDKKCHIYCLFARPLPLCARVKQT
jgi:hypothetical protein